MSACRFALAWSGACGEPATAHGRCAKHEPLRCAACGARATRECDATAEFVCGEPLCDTCEHRDGGGHQRGRMPTMEQIELALSDPMRRDSLTFGDRNMVGLLALARAYLQLREIAQRPRRDVPNPMVVFDIDESLAADDPLAAIAGLYEETCGG